MSVPSIFLLVLGSVLAVGASAQVHVDSTGKVGMGSNSPTTRLHVKDGASGVTGGSYAEHIRVENSGNTGLLLSTPRLAAAYIYHSTPFDSASAGIKFDGNARYMSFFTNNGTERMRITNQGRVGIGTSSPASLFDVHKGSSGVSGGYYTYHMRAESDGDTGFVMNTPRLASAYIYHSTPLDGGSSGIKFEGDSRYMAFLVKNGNERMRITSSGDVGIGTTSPGYKLHVNGTVRANSFVSNTTTYADFVFEDDYMLPSLSDVESFIKANGHLPGIPSEAEAMANGIDLADMQVRLLQKVEELTLHQIYQGKRLQALTKENAALRDQLK